jgi:DNA helicase-2/ATP-dependent DNA helicase PcrA
MTVHCAKGLEFDTVFIVGLEDGVFPSIRAVEEQGDLEEERRLFYVALTRAKRRCFVSYAASRLQFGKVRWNVPSPFLYELPRDLLVPAAEAIQQECFYEGDNSPKQRSVSIESPVGRKVVHPFFGEGEIIGIKGTNPKRKLVIAFSDGLIHEILEKYAQLQYLS